MEKKSEKMKIDKKSEKMEKSQKILTIFQICWLCEYEN